MSVTVVPVTTPHQMAVAWTIRREVFIGEQGVSEEEELDGWDEQPTTRHVLAVDIAGDPVGTARLLIGRPGQVHIGRVAVLARARGQGVGARIMEALEDIAATQGADAHGRVRIDLSAQETAMEFYRRLGYQIAPQRYLDARMWHRDAHKTLST